MALDPAFIALGLIPRVGSKLLRTLLDVFGTPQAILAADEAALRRVPGVGKHIARQIHVINIDSVNQYINRWQAEKIHLLTWYTPAYPAIFQSLPDAPPVLFKCGNWNTQDDKTIAIVGTRRPSAATGQLAQLLAYTLANTGWTIVSGLALGIDSCAHRGALAVVQQGKTVAILGSGVKQIYPPANQALAQTILDRGAILAEVAPETKVSSAQLVARNRLITGLSRAVVVIEAHEASAMHAVRFALDQNRPVYVMQLPAAGNQRLLRDHRITPLNPDPDAVPETVARLTENVLRN